jgi:steroid 5-alpha reductase family enzyme
MDWGIKLVVHAGWKMSKQGYKEVKDMTLRRIFDNTRSCFNAFGLFFLGEIFAFFIITARELVTLRSSMRITLQQRPQIFLEIAATCL